MPPFNLQLKHYQQNALDDLQYVEWPLTRTLASHLFLTLRIEAITKPPLES